MKFLLAIGSKEYSEPTLQIGSQIAKSFDAHLGIVYVGSKPRQIYESRVSLARDSLARWEIYHPGVEVLHWAFDYLRKSGYLEEKDENGFHPENIVEEASRFRLVLPGSYGRDVSLILREGDIIEELRKECGQDSYTLSIIGGSKGRRMAHNLLQYIPTSMFVAKDVDQKKKYKLLLCVDDSKATKRAVRRLVSPSDSAEPSSPQVWKRPMNGVLRNSFSGALHLSHDEACRLEDDPPWQKPLHKSEKTVLPAVDNRRHPAQSIQCG